MSRGWLFILSITMAPMSVTPSQAQWRHHSSGHSHEVGYSGNHYVRSWGGYGGVYVGPSTFGYPGFYGYPQSAYWGAPVYLNSPFVYGFAAPGPFISGLENVTFPGYFTTNPAPLSPSVAMPAGYPEGRGLIDAVHPLAEKTDSAKRPVIESSPAARLKSLEKQAAGDEKLRKQQWGHAYLEYKAAADTAPDRAEAHFRLGFLYTAMQHYASAVKEFKRGLFLDSSLPQTGVKMKMLFGPNSQIVRTSIMHKVADWVREDVRDPDRLFLFGLLLHYEDDSRGREVLEAASRMAPIENQEHILAFLNNPTTDHPEVDPPKPATEGLELPKLITPPVPAPAAEELLPAPLPLAPIPDQPSALPPLSTERKPPK